MQYFIDCASVVYFPRSGYEGHSEDTSASLPARYSGAEEVGSGVWLPIHSLHDRHCHASSTLNIHH